MRAFEMALGRPINADEIEPRNAAYRRAGRELSAVAYLESRAWFGIVGAPDGGLVETTMTCS